MIPAGTPETTPVSIGMVFPQAQVDVIQIRVPRGPNGQMGFSLGSRGVQVLPFNQGAYLVTDDERIDLDVTDQFTSGDWSLIGYNLGQENHTVYIRFLCSPVAAAPETGAVPSITAITTLTSD